MTGDERPMLTVWLDYQRATLLWKCEGLDGAALVRRGVPPSSLTPPRPRAPHDLVEWRWFDHIFTGSPSPRADLDAGGSATPTSTTSTRPGRWPTSTCSSASATCSRAIVAPPPSLDALAASTEKPPCLLRWIMVHMIEEYARHNGHADLLREQIDGAVGE